MKLSGVVSMNDEEIKYKHCNDCGYENTSYSDDCHACGSLNVTFHECSLEEWLNEH